MFNEEDFQNLSRDVYRIDAKHRNNDPNIKEGEIRKIDDLKYRILQVEDNITNGMQAMAVSPVKNGKADTSEITIAYAGTNLLDPLDRLTDAQTVVLGNKGLVSNSQQLDMSKHHELDEQGIPKSIEYVDGQVISAEKFAEDVKSDYPNAVIETTGHSLGGYIALYIAGELGMNSTVYNAPDPYNILSKEAKARIEKNPEALINYRNEKDVVGNSGSNGTGAEIRIDMGETETGSHSLNTWEFNTDGEVKIPDTPENAEARLILVEKHYARQKSNLFLLADKFKTSGGMSSNEEIFLDHTEALLTVEHTSQSMKLRLESIIKIYLDAIQEAEEVWERGIEVAKSIGTELSYGEILNVLAEEGATKHAIVFEPTAYYREKISVALEIGNDFDRLASDIQASIEALVQSDKRLANQIEQGV